MTTDHKQLDLIKLIITTGYPLSATVMQLKPTMCLVTVVVCPAIVYPVAGQLVGDAQRGLSAGELITRVVNLHLPDLCPHGPESLGTH